MSCATTLHASQRGSAWAAMMTRGQTVAGAAPKPAAPWMGGVRASAWAAEMTRGHRAPAAVAGEDSNITHRCDGCPNGEPCPNCGGNIRKDHPAYQALQWGMMEADLRPGLSPSERAALISQAIADAPARSGDAEWGALISFGRTKQALHAFLAAAPAATDQLDAAKWNPPPETQALVDGAEPSGGVSRYIPAYPTRPRCCVSVFDYPVPGSVHPVDADDEEARAIKYVGWRFDVLAVYEDSEGEPVETPDGEVVVCRCSCCEFRQYDALAATISGELDPLSHSTRIDCTRTKDGKIVCPGSRDPEHAYPKGYVTGDGRVVEEWDGECIYKYHDLPRFPVPWRSSFSIFWGFTGVIHDTCLDWQIVRLEQFWLWSAGSVDEAGKVSYTLKPPAEAPQGWKRLPGGRVRRVF